MVDKITTSILLIVLLGSCSHPAHKSAKSQPVTKRVVSAIKSARNGDTLLIRTQTAVSFWLDSDKIEKLKKRDTAGFYVGADDYVNYSSMSDSVLEKLKLPVISGDGCHYLKFVQNSGAITLIKTDTLSELYSLYFFKPSRTPVKADISDIEDAYKEYFEK